MHRLKMMKEQLVSCLQTQLSGNLAEVDAEELGEVVDMVKDLEEAIYYATITKAMDENEQATRGQDNRMFYIDRYINPAPYRDMDREYGRMYYSGGYNMGGNSSGRSDGGNSSGNSQGGNSGQRNYPMEIRDYREGRSPMSRRNYMETKEMHHGIPAQMKELEKYLQELASDVNEMIEDASPEEKTLLQQKLTHLASKIK